MRPVWCRTNCVAYIHEVLGPIWKAFYPGFLGTFGQWQERWTHWLYRNVPFWTACESTGTICDAMEFEMSRSSGMAFTRKRCPNSR